MALREEEFELGVVTVEVTTTTGECHFEDWNPKDADEALDYAEATAHCSDVSKTVFNYASAPKKTSQRGMMSSEMFFYYVIFSVCCFGFLVYNGYKLNQMEVTAEEYKKLNAIANESCSGNAYLKVKVTQGPILNKDYPDILFELNRKADAQAAVNARSAIVNVVSECS